VAVQPVVALDAPTAAACAAARCLLPHGTQLAASPTLKAAARPPARRLYRMQSSPQDTREPDVALVLFNQVVRGAGWPLVRRAAGRTAGARRVPALPAPWLGQLQQLAASQPAAGGGPHMIGYTTCACTQVREQHSPAAGQGGGGGLAGRLRDVLGGGGQRGTGYYQGEGGEGGPLW
jgi:hypothetical protein